MTKLDKLLNIERQINIALWCSFISLTFSGSWNWFFSVHSQFSLWLGIYHGIMGVVFTFSIFLFGFIHFRRTIGYRRPATMILGFLAWFTLLALVYSGISLLWNGRVKTDTVLHSTHIILALSASFLVIVHLIAYFKVVGSKQNADEIFPSVNKPIKRNVLKVFGCICAVFFMSVACSSLYDPKYTTHPVAGSYTYDYGNHPFRPSQTETFNHTFIDNRMITRSSECAVCHQDVANQWIDSAHKKASSDPTYVRNINLLATKKGISATRYCEGCHAPVALLTGALSNGGFHGGIPNTDANREGVNCMSCHGIKKLEHLKGNASYLFSPPQDYLFEGSQNAFLKAINRFSIRLNPKQHKNDMGNSLTKKSEFCAACHAQFMDKEMNNWGWVKMQDDYSAWLNGPYSGQNPRFNLPEPVNCQSCHMPKVSISDPTADEKGMAKSHRFIAANTLLALLSDSKTQYEETVRFLQANKVRVTIDKPNRDTAAQTYAPLEKPQRDQVTAPYYFYLNEQASLNTIVSNIGVGHNFPGGTIDINEAWIELVVTDAQGKTVYTSGLLNEKKEVDVNAYFYRSMPVDKLGKDVWRHDLFNMIGDRFRNSIPAGGSDIANFKFNVPSWAISPLQVSATVKYRKLNKKYSAWALENENASLPIVDMARDSLAVPIKKQPEIISTP